MEEYTVALTPQAEQQLRAIVHHIAHELLEPETADALLTALEQAMASLSLLPQRAPLVEEEPWHSQNIRKLLCRNFLIYFWPDLDSHRVQILAVLYGRRDQLNQLRNLKMNLQYPQKGPNRAEISGSGLYFHQMVQASLLKSADTSSVVSSRPLWSFTVTSL